VEYELTDHGKTLAPILKSMCDWGFRHLEYLAAQGKGEKFRGGVDAEEAT